MPYDINSQQVDIENLFKQNANDLSSIKELYRKLKDLEEKISQIKYIDSKLADKIKKDYESLKKIILDENIQAKLTNDIVKINNDIVKINNDNDKVSSQLDTKVNRNFKCSELGMTTDDIDKTNFSKLCNAINNGTSIYVDNNYTINVDTTFNLSNNLIINSNLNELNFIGNSDVIFNITSDIDLINIDNVKIKCNNKIIFYNDSITYKLNRVEICNNHFSDNTILFKLNEVTGSFNSKINLFNFNNNTLENINITEFSNISTRGFINIINVPFEKINLNNNIIHNSKILPFYLSVDDDNNYRDVLGLSVLPLLEKRKYVSCSNNTFKNDDKFYNDRIYSTWSNVYYGLIMVECYVIDFKNNTVENVISKNTSTSQVSTNYIYSNSYQTNVEENNIKNVYSDKSVALNYLIKTKAGFNIYYNNNKFDFNNCTSPLIFLDCDSKNSYLKWTISNNEIKCNNLTFEQEQITSEYFELLNNNINCETIDLGFHVGTSPVINNTIKRKYKFNGNIIKANSTPINSFEFLKFGYNASNYDTIKGSYLYVENNFFDMPNFFNDTSGGWQSPRFEVFKVVNNVFPKRPIFRYNQSGFIYDGNKYIDTSSIAGNLSCCSFYGDSSITETFNVLTNSFTASVGDLTGIERQTDYLKDTHAQLITFECNITCLDGTQYSNVVTIAFDILNNLIYDYNNNTTTDITNYVTSAISINFTKPSNPIKFKLYKKTSSYFQVIIDSTSLNTYITTVNLKYNVKHILHENIIPIS